MGIDILSFASYCYRASRVNIGRRTVMNSELDAEGIDLDHNTGQPLRKSRGCDSIWVP